MNLREISESARTVLSRAFDDKKEVEVLLNRLEEEILSFPSYLRVTEPATPVSDKASEKFLSAVDRVCKREPLQYILGYETFYGRRFNVNPSVLIPRPETEELCREAIALIKGNSRPQRVLDLCTGSGCIAWTIALETGVETVAVDISEAALSVASSQTPVSNHNHSLFCNSEQLPASKQQEIKPKFVLADVLAGPNDFAKTYPQLCSDGFDLIVSNPPYVMEKEKALMSANVLEHEPHLALFVPDEDPLIFYRAIASWAASLLRKGGACIMEINESLPKETAAVFADFTSVSIVEDMFSKPRMIVAKH